MLYITILLQIFLIISTIFTIFISRNVSCVIESSFIIKCTRKCTFWI